MIRITLLLSTILFFSFSLSAQQVDHVLGEILIKPIDEKNIEKILSRYHSFNGRTTGLKNKRLVSKNVGIYLIEFDFGTIDEAAFLNTLKRDPLVAEAQYNHLVKMRATPNDPLFSNQWQWVNPNDADVDAELAWNITTGGLTTQGDEIVVAVLDDGTELTHPDLQANHWVNTAEIPNNNIDDDNNGYVDDYNGWSIITDDDNVSGGSHGVNVNGMIGAVGNDGNQGTGINWSVKIMTVKNNFNTNEAAVLEAYDYPLTARRDYNNSGGTKGAYVVATNASWGIDNGNPANAPLWCAFYDTLGDEGILNCGATSNSTVNIDVVGDLPTACPSDFMVAVTRTDSNDNQFGGYGTTQIDVGAPGQGIFTAAAGGGYTTSTGTSFASPLTAGIIALMYSVPCDNLIALSKSDPAAAALQVRNYLYSGVDPVLPNLVATGGRVNAFNSCQLIVDNCGPPANNCPTDLVLSGNMALITKTENASNSITSTEIVNSNSDITYEAGNFIQLDPGFEVIINSDFLAHIVSCTPIIGDHNTYGMIATEINVHTLQNKKEIAISFNVDTDESDITIAVTDDFGNVVKSYVINQVNKGSHQLSVDISDLKADGSYKVVVLRRK